MGEDNVAQTLIRLINERPTGVWYMRKSHYPRTNWNHVTELVRQQGYTVEDSGEIIRGSKCAK